MTEIVVGHACPDCGSQHIVAIRKGSTILCDECGWKGTFEGLKELKVVL